MGAVLSRLQDGVFTIAGALRTISALNSKYKALLQRISSDPGLPVPNPTASYWMQNPPFPELSDLQPELLPAEADVVIIGSGITGAAAAKTICELSSARTKVVVLEARQLCSGATARNGGHIKCTPHADFAQLSRIVGEERARKAVRMEMRHLEVLCELGEGIPSGEVREVETADVFIEEQAFKEAKEGVEKVREWMPEMEAVIWEAEEARDKFGLNEHVVGAVSYKAGALWPYRLITGVWNDLVKRYPNLTISTHTPVEAITTDDASSPGYPYRAHTSRGSIKARHVFHATNGYAGHLVPALRGRLTGIIGHMTAQRPGRDFPPTHGQRSWSVMSDGFEYITQRPDEEDGSAGDLMLGGGLFRSRDRGMDQVGVWDDGRVDTLPLMHLRGSMKTVFEPRWGAEGGLKKAWTGIMGFTGDWMPFVGPLPGSIRSRGGMDGSGQWIAAGFNGEGMVWAWLSGTAAAIMLLGKEEEDLERAVGRPGGKLDEWFPREDVAVDAARLRRADLKNLAGELMPV